MRPIRLGDYEVLRVKGLNEEPQSPEKLLGEGAAQWEILHATAFRGGPYVMLLGKRRKGTTPDLPPGALDPSEFEKPGPDVY